MPDNFRTLAGVALLTLAACTTPDASPPTAPAEQVLSKASSDPTFLTLDPNAPVLATPSVSFWAVNGQTREGFLWYHPRAGSADSSKLARLRIDRRSLCQRTDGSVIAPGDSILLTMTVTDPATQLVEMQPHGLVFCNGRPAQLQMWYVEVEHDFDGDGDIDGADTRIERSLSIWRRALPGDPWQRVQGSMVELAADEVEVDLRGFSGYLVAY
jgi:hypothetical protein